MENNTTNMLKKVGAVGLVVVMLLSSLTVPTLVAADHNTTTTAERVSVVQVGSPGTGFLIPRLETGGANATVQSITVTSSDAASLESSTYDDLTLQRVQSDGSLGSLLFSKSNSALGTQYSVGATIVDNGNTSQYDAELVTRQFQNSSGGAIAVSNLNATWTIKFADGSVLTVDWNAGSYTTSVQSPNHNPVADFTDSDNSKTAEVGTNVTLDASASSDYDNDSLVYSWDLNGDGVFGDRTGANITVSESSAGTYNYTVLVDDGNGGVDTKTITVEFVSSTATTTPSGGGGSGTTSGSLLGLGAIAGIPVSIILGIILGMGVFILLLDE